MANASVMTMPIQESSSNCKKSYFFSSIAFIHFAGLK